MEFIFYSINKRYKLALIFSIAVLVINMLAFAYISINNNYKGWGFPVILLILLSLFFIVKKKSKSYTIVVAYIFTMFYWLEYENYYMFFATFILSTLFFAIRDKYRFNFTAKGVEFFNLFSPAGKKLSAWNELSNVVLKDGLLTLDYKNNKLLQTEVSEDFYIKESEFNAFCKAQISKA